MDVICFHHVLIIILILIHLIFRSLMRIPFKHLNIGILRLLSHDIVHKLSEICTPISIRDAPDSLMTLLICRTSKISDSWQTSQRTPFQSHTPASSSWIFLSMTQTKSAMRSFNRQLAGVVKLISTLTTSRLNSIEPW